MKLTRRQLRKIVESALNEQGLPAGFNAGDERPSPVQEALRALADTYDDLAKNYERFEAEFNKAYKESGGGNIDMSGTFLNADPYHLLCVGPSDLKEIKRIDPQKILAPNINSNKYKILQSFKNFKNDLVHLGVIPYTGRSPLVLIQGPVFDSRGNTLSVETAIPKKFVFPTDDPTNIVLDTDRQFPNTIPPKNYCQSIQSISRGYEYSKIAAQKCRDIAAEMERQ